MPTVRSPGRVYFRMLGTIMVAGADAPLVPDLMARPKAMALLAFLVLESRDGPCSRDAVLAHFWPESSVAAARQALRQALYELRQALGPGVIEGHGQHDVWLSRERFSADALELLEALEAGRIQAAFDLYRGELLPGLHFSGASPEFESWLDRARADMRRLLTAAVWTAHDGAEAVGRPDEAIRLGLRGLELEPYNEERLRRMMEQLHRGGRGAEAIRLYRQCQGRLTAELDVACDPATEALAARIATALQWPRAPAPVLLEGEPAGEAAPETSPQHLSGHPLPAPAAGPRRDGVPPADLQPHRRIRWVVGGSLLAVSALVLSLTLWPVRTGSGEEAGLVALAEARLADPPVVGAPDRGAILVLGPIESPEPDLLAGVAVASALTWLLAGQDVGPGGQLAGRIEPSGGGWDLDLTLRRPGDNFHIGGFVPGDLLSVVREVSDALKAALQIPEANRHRLLPSNEAALRAHLRGEWLLERGEVYAAAEAFQRAVQEDPGFALGYHHLSLAASIGFDAARAEEAELTALSLQARLPEAEALIVEARRAYRTGQPDEAEALLNTVLILRPGHLEASYHAAEVLFHYNPLRGRPLAEARPALERASTRALNRTETIYHITQTALLMGDIQGFDRASGSLLEMAPAGLRSRQLLALRAKVLGTPDDWRRELAGLTGARDLIVMSTAHNLGVYAGDIPAALEVLAILTRPDRELGVRARAHATRADLLAAAGRPREVALELRRAMELDPRVGASRAAHLLTLGVLPPDDAGLHGLSALILRDEHSAVRPMSEWMDVETVLEPWLGPHTRALTALAAGDSIPARTLAGALERAPEGRAGVLLRGDLALRLAGSGLARHYDPVAFSTRGVRPEEAILSPLFSRPLARLVQGRVERQQGRLRQADRWFHSLLEHSLPDLALAAVALGESARTAEMRGDTAGARRALGRLDRLQENAEESYLQWRQAQPWGGGFVTATPGTGPQEVLPAAVGGAAARRGSSPPVALADPRT
jgi:DNA-binding SARP family transcriptional activator